MNNNIKHTVESFGQTLPQFPSFLEARHALLARRDECLQMFEEIRHRQQVFTPDYSPKSLEQLDDLYRTLYKTDTFEEFCCDRSGFEECMAMYFGEVIVRTKGAEWIVEEFFFMQGRYQIGIRVRLHTQMLRPFTDYYKSLQGKRHPMLKAYKRF